MTDVPKGAAHSCDSRTPHPRLERDSTTIRSKKCCRGMASHGLRRAVIGSGITGGRGRGLVTNQHRPTGFINCSLSTANHIPLLQSLLFPATLPSTQHNFKFIRQPIPATPTDAQWHPQTQSPLSSQEMLSPTSCVVSGIVRSQLQSQSHPTLDILRCPSQE
jgi:hypothetical protein